MTHNQTLVHTAFSHNHHTCSSIHPTTDTKASKLTWNKSVSSNFSQETAAHYTLPLAANHWLGATWCQGATFRLQREGMCLVWDQDCVVGGPEHPTHVRSCYLLLCHFSNTIIYTAKNSPESMWQDELPQQCPKSDGREKLHTDLTSNYMDPQYK
jgi:hypothetical protein